MIKFREFTLCLDDGNVDSCVGVCCVCSAGAVERATMCLGGDSTPTTATTTTERACHQVHHLHSAVNLFFKSLPSLIFDLWFALLSWVLSVPEVKKRDVDLK
jgi:hypothetical protein